TFLPHIPGAAQAADPTPLSIALQKHLDPASLAQLGTLQQDDGSWHDTTTSLPSPLVTAIVLQAAMSDSSPKTKTPQNELYTRIVQTTRQELALFDEPLRSALQQALETIIRADKNQEIALLPTFFAHSLRAHSFEPA